LLEQSHVTGSNGHRRTGDHCTRRTRPEQNTTDESAADVDALIWRMQDGDREAAAAFVSRYGPRLLRRIRNKISINPAMRRVFDSQDILSTVGRRLDLYVLTGRLQATSLGQLLSLVEKMVDHAVIDKTRVFDRLRRAEDEDGPFAQELLRRLRRAGHDDRYGVEVQLQKALRLFRDKADRTILTHWLEGRPHSETASMVGMTATAVRKRWQKIRMRLQERFAEASG
jgi:hypothetical protein